MRSLVAFAILAWWALPVAAAPKWTLRTTSPIDFVEVTSLGNLLVGTEDDLAGVDPLAGTIAWRRADLRALSRENVELIRGTREALIVTRDKDSSRLELLSLETGETRWVSDRVAIKGIRWQSPAPGERLIVVGALPAGRSRVMAFDLAQGGFLWQSDSLLVGTVEAVAGAGAWESPNFITRSNLGKEAAYVPSVSAARAISRDALPPVFDGDSAMTLFLTPAGPVRVDLHTGLRSWVSSVRSPYLPLVSSGFAPMLATDSLVLIPYMRSLRAVRRRDGGSGWESDVEFKSKVAQMQLTPRGVLVRGTPQPKTFLRLGWAGTGRAFLALLDPETGKTIWNRPLHAKGDVSAFVSHGDSIYVVADAELSLVDLRDGSAREISYGWNQPRQALIEKKPSPIGIEWRPSGVFIWSGTECWLVDPVAGLRYHTRPEPQKSDATALGAGILVFDALSVLGWFLAGGIALASGDLSLFDTIMRSTPPVIDPSIVRHRELPRARLGAHYAYFATRMRDEHGKAGVGLLRVYKDTGRVDGEIFLGPVDDDDWFGLDAAAGVLFARQGKQTISAFDL